MYQNIYIERGEGYGADTIHLWDDEMGYQILPYKDFDYAYKPDRAGKFVSMTGVRLSKVKRYKRDDPNIFESDLPQETRVLTDLYLNDDEPSKGHNVMFFDIEVSMENGVPIIENPNNEITSIAVYDSVTQQYTVLVLDKSGIHPSYEKENINVVMYDSELNLLYGFLDLYEQINPTIISGWNSDYFDVPYLYNRLRQQCGPNTAGRLSPIGKIKWSNFRRKYQIAGVSGLDYMDLYKKFTYTQLPNYRLDTVGRMEVSMGKVEYDGSLDELFRDDLAKFIEYNLQDVRIIVEMDKKLKLIELVRGICHIGHVQYEDYCYSSKFLEGTIVTYLHRKGVIVTNKPAGGREMMDQRMENDEEGFSGAYVKEPVPGLYDWIYSLDLQSLYPSIIMSLNISPETKIGYVTNWDIQKHTNEQIDEYLIRGTNSDDVVRLPRDKFFKYMNNEKIMISSNGVLYTGTVPGIIPEVLDRWFAERVEYKNLMKKYKNEGNTELAEFYDRRQHIQKIFLNSLYGVLGLPIFRFFDIDNALAVTASGQDVIKNSAKFVNELYTSKTGQQEDYCTYIDTDSLYFSATPLMPENGGKEFTIKLARAMEKKLNEYYTKLAKDLFFCDSHRFYIKGESVATTGIWIAKKRYAMNVVYDLESNMDVDNKMKVKGLDVVRSSFPPAFRDFMKGMMKDVLNKVTKVDIDSKVLTFRDQLNTMEYLEVARNTAVKNISEYDTGTKKLGDFKKGTPAHVKAALSYNSLLHHFGIENRYESIEDGAKIKWVYLAQNPYNLEAVAVKGYNDPPQIIELVKAYIDYKALFENELQKKLEDFYSALKWGNIPTEINQNASEWFNF